MKFENVRPGIFLQVKHNFGNFYLYQTCEYKSLAIGFVCPNDKFMVLEICNSMMKIIVLGKELSGWLFLVFTDMFDEMFYEI